MFYFEHEGNGTLGNGGKAKRPRKNNLFLDWLLLLLRQEMGGHVRSAEYHIESEILCAQLARCLDGNGWECLENGGFFR